MSVPILCLHGKQQNADIFCERLRRLRRRLSLSEASSLSFTFAFVDAPFDVTDDGFPSEDRGKRTWLLSRTKGLLEAYSVMESAFQETAFQGIVAFSQGGIIAALVAALAETKAPPFESLSWVVIAGSPDVEEMGRNEDLGAERGPFLDALRVLSDEGPVGISSLHIFGRADDIVPSESSVRLLQRFQDAQVYEHDGGHHLPQRVQDLDFLESWIIQVSEASNAAEPVAGDQNLVEPSAWTEEQATSIVEELDALYAIFETDLVCKTTPKSVKEEAAEADLVTPFEGASINSEIVLLEFRIDGGATELETPLPGPLTLEIEMVAEYPSTLPEFHLAHDMSFTEMPTWARSALLQHIRRIAKEHAGDQLLYDVLSGAQEWIISRWAESSWQRLEADSEGNDLGLQEADSDTLPSADPDVKTSLSEDAEIDGLELDDRVLVQDAAQFAQTRYHDLKKNDSLHGSAIADNVARTEERVLVEAQEPSENGPQKPWTICLGLVGKPSAGKSTFFNAATQKDAARTAAFPFTTIDPNDGTGYFTIPCPCGDPIVRQYLNRDCDARYGHVRTCVGNTSLMRRHPLRLRDVAGLVPGAYAGKGRGNQFLDHLCDADVLIHIVDASGKTDNEGNATEDYDPSMEIAWVREELHRWIFNNVNDKFDSVVKRVLRHNMHGSKTGKQGKGGAKDRFMALFSGYRAKRSLIDRAFRLAGVDLDDPVALSRIPDWEPMELHRVVACFLQIRFPIVVALNKVDEESSRVHVANIIQKFPLLECVPVSSRIECELQSLKRKGRIRYEDGGGSFDVLDGSAELQHLVGEAETVLQAYGTTGVLKAVNAAIALADPLFVFPVGDLRTLTAIGESARRQLGLKQGFSEGESDEAAVSEGDLVLKDCLMMHRGATVGDVFAALKHQQILAGDFVRAEVFEPAKQGNGRVVRKADTLGRYATGSTDCGQRSTGPIVQIMSTRRAR